MPMLCLRQRRKDLEQAEQWHSHDWIRSEDPEHACNLQPFEEIRDPCVVLLGFEGAERFSEAEVAEDVESSEVKPSHDIDRSVRVGLLVELVDKDGDVRVDNVFLAPEGLVGECVV